MTTLSNFPVNLAPTATSSSSTSGIECESIRSTDKRSDDEKVLPRKPARKRARFGTDQEDASQREPIDFAVVEVPHPYGVLPSGNRLLDGDRNARVAPPVSLLSDEGWYGVLEYCDAVDLGRVIQTCRYFYAVGSEPELWRDLVLRRTNKSKETIAVAGPTWKDTLVKLLQRRPDPDWQPHVPIPISAVYSDMLYRLHSCRSFTIPSSWRDIRSGNVCRVPWQEMSVERFELEFEGRNLPVIIDGAATSWRAFERWREPSYLLDQTQGQSFRATSGAAALPGNFELSAYLEYCRSSTLEEAPLYLFDRAALKPDSTLWNDYMSDLQRTCPYFDPCRAGTSHDLFQVLGEGSRPDHTWLIVGPRRSGSVFHIDPNATHAWNVSVVGTKFWIFYPPGVTPPGVHPSSDGDHVALPLSLGEWLLQFWDDHQQRMRFGRPDERPLECTTCPGDIMFVPHGWWHLVVNLDDLNIAITHNYASGSNLPSVLKFLDEKRDQVSGCRDRPDSIKPERLYEEFVSALQERHPALVEEALQDPHWACRAWHDGGGGNSSCDVPEPAPATGGGGSSSSVMSKAKESGAHSGFTFSFL